MHYMDKIIGRLLQKRVTILYELYTRLGEHPDVEEYVREGLDEVDKELKKVEARYADNS